jgi:hypothetical protein
MHVGEDDYRWHIFFDAHTYRERDFYDFKVGAPEPMRYE